MSQTAEVLRRIKAQGESLLGAVAQLEERAVRVHEALDRLSEVSSKFNEVSEECQEKAEQGETLKEDLAKLFEGLTEEGEEVIEDAEGEVAEAADEFAEITTSQLADISDAVVEKADATATAVREFRLQLSQRVSRVVEKELPDAVNASAAPVLERIEDFQDTAVDRMQQVTEVFEGIRERARFLLDLLEAIKPVLELVRSIS